jgi:hypothetical protein
VYTLAVRYSSIFAAFRRAFASTALSFAFILAVFAYAATDDSDPWPMTDGRTWRYLDAEGREAVVKARAAGRKNLEIDGEKVNVAAYVVETQFEGKLIRRETYLKTATGTYKLRLMQLVDVVSIEFTPPIKVSGAERRAGSRWSSKGAASITSGNIGKPAKYDYECDSRITLEGAIMFEGSTMETFSVETKLSFHGSDSGGGGENAFGGSETVQYIVGVGPKRIMQGEGFDRTILTLQERKA